MARHSPSTSTPPYVSGDSAVLIGQWSGVVPRNLCVSGWFGPLLEQEHRQVGVTTYRCNEERGASIIR